MEQHPQLNDPDFDQPLERLSPKTLFLGGIVTGVMVLCTIGFFILLSV